MNLLGRWLTSGVTAAKFLIARLAFLLCLIVLLPLAVLNRQSVVISLNPMDLMRAEPQSAIEMPLFIALFISLIVGLMLGWVLQRMAGNKTRNNPKNQAAPTLPTLPGMVKTAQLKADTSKDGDPAQVLTHRQASVPEHETTEEDTGDER